MINPNGNVQEQVVDNGNILPSQTNTQQADVVTHVVQRVAVQAEGISSNLPRHFTSINAFIPQTNGAHDEFWEDIINSSEDILIEDSEDLSDINSSDNQYLQTYDYSPSETLWPQDKNIPLTSTDLVS